MIVRLFAVLLFLAFYPSCWCAEGAGTDAVVLKEGRRLLVRKILPRDCRLVRGFTHAPVDGREDTRHATGGVSEWSGVYGTPAVNYRIFNGNNGLHLTLAEHSFDALQIRGEWQGRLYADYGALTQPTADVPALCDIRPENGVFHKRFKRRIRARRLSFFYEEGQTGSLNDVAVLRVEERAFETPANALTLSIGDGVEADDPVRDHLPTRSGEDPRVVRLGTGVGGTLSLRPNEFVHLVADAQDESLGIGAIMLEMEISEITRDSLLRVRIADVLDRRREVMATDFRAPEPGRFIVCLDVPDQVFLPPESQWTTQPRMKGPFAPPPMLCLSIASDSTIRFDKLAVTVHRIPRDEALVEAVAWRKFLLKGLFSAMSEPRPWMHLVDGKPIREQIKTSPAIKRYRTSLIELLETAEMARLLAPQDELVQQYHNWLYQNMDRRKPQPPSVLPDMRDAPRWAVLIRENWKEQAHIARWWLDNRMVSDGELGGGPQDDTDMFQVWQCLPMIESEPLGARLKDAAAKLAEITLEHHLEEGINRRSMDALHAYEEGVNQLALNAWWNYGDPVHFERVMASARSAMKLMVETEDGRIHFGGNHLGIEEARSGFKNIGASPGAFGWAPARLFLHPMYVVADYNRNLAVLQRYTRWGQTWLDYQKPNAFVEKVDIKSGKPIKVINLPASANVGPVEDLLAIHQLTDDAKWHASYKMGVDGNGFTGAVAQYGRCTHALVSWDEPYRSRLRKQFSDPSSGYAGFFVNKDRELLDKWLSDSLSWFHRYRFMNTAAEQKTDRVLTYKATVPISCYLGDAPNRNRWLNLTAASYERLQGEDFAALVWDAGPKTLRVAFYNFRDELIGGRMRVWRLEHGRYQVRSGPDRDDDGSMDEVADEQTLELQRHSAIPLNLPPRQVTVLKIEQLERLDDIRNRADLALSLLDTRLEGETLTARVHNIGNQSAEDVRVVVTRDGKVVAEQTISRLEAPRDAMPRMIQLQFKSVRSGDVLQVDPEDRLPEIAEHNNLLVLGQTGA